MELQHYAFTNSPSAHGPSLNHNCDSQLPPVFVTQAAYYFDDPVVCRTFPIPGFKDCNQGGCKQPVRFRHEFAFHFHFASLFLPHAANRTMKVGEGIHEYRSSLERLLGWFMAKLNTLSTAGSGSMYRTSPESPDRRVASPEWQQS